MKKIKDYCYENRYQIFIFTFFLILGYGIKIFNISISHDTEAIIAVPQNLYGSWLQMGRFGQIVLKKLLGTYCFNPYIAAFMMVIMMIVSAILWGYLFSIVSEKRNKIFLWIFGTVFFTSTIMAEQEAFLLQAYEVTVAIGLVAVALILLLEGKKEKNKFKIVGAMLVLLIAFATYQAMVVLYVAGATSCFLFYYENHEERNFKDYIAYIGYLIGLFAVTYIVYFLINKLILFMLGIETTSYIDGQVAWTTQGIKSCLFNIYEHILEVIKGKTFFYTPILKISIILTIIRLFLQKKKKCYWLYSLATIFMFICPFLMTIVLGNTPSHRTELNIPFVTAILVVQLAIFLQNKKRWMYNIALVAVFVIGMYQSQQTSRLYYTEYVQNQQDMMLATKISDRIEQLNVDTSQIPVVFVGAHKMQRNLSCLSEKEFEMTGWSFFEISYSTGHGTWEMQHYLATLGIDYLYPSSEQIEIAENIANGMQAWPSTESVKFSNGVIVVKF